MDERKKRRFKYQAPGDSEKQNLKNSIIPIDEAMLNIFCAYSVSKNARIHKTGLSALYNLIMKLDENHFNSQTALIKMKFIKKVLYERTHGIYDRSLLLASADKEVDVKALSQDPMFLKELTDQEINFVERSVTEFLNLTGLFSELTDLKRKIIAFEQADMRNRTPLLESIRSSATDLLNQFRRNDINQDSSDTIFRLSSMPEHIMDIHRQVTSPSFKLRTGMKGLNALLGGGLEQGNVYCFFGLPGEGKTITIENLLYQVWKYNRGYVCRDKTKRPAIVLLTMENFVRQTVCALYSIITGKNMRECKTPQEAIKAFKENAFEFRTDEPNDIEIVIKFKPVNSVTTDYCNKIIEDLADEGYEVICFFQDYLKRILPVLRTNDPYQDLGNVTNEFKTIATLNRIPFVTVSQLNRDAARIVDEGRNQNKTDLIQRLGRSNIGESSRIDENLDGTFIITPEVTMDGKKFMGIKNTKHRYELLGKNIALSFYQPFKEGSAIALVEDADDINPSYVESLGKQALDDSKSSFANVEKAAIVKSIKSLEHLQADQMIQHNNGIALPRKLNKPSTVPPPEYSLHKCKPLLPVLVPVSNKTREELGIIDYHIEGNTVGLTNTSWDIEQGEAIIEG